MNACVAESLYLFIHLKKQNPHIALKKHLASNGQGVAVHETQGTPARSNHRSMAIQNSLSVLHIIHRHAFISQRQIVAATGIRPSTVSNIIRELKDAGMVRENGTLESGGVGARQVSLEIDASFSWVASWMIDLKGHQICLMDAAGRVIALEKLPLDLGWQAIAEQLHHRIATLAETRRLPRSRFSGVGIAVQGIVNSATGEVIYSFPHQMEGILLRDIVQKNFKVPVHVERNIPCAAYLEQHNTIARQNSSFLYYLLRRHEDFFEHGMGIMLNGEVFHGSHFAAGELDADFFPRKPSLKEIKREQDWNAIYRDFGRTAARIGDFLDVDEIIISSDDPGLTEKRFHLLEQEIQARIRPIRNRTIVVSRSQTGPEGILLGAGLMALHHHFRRTVEALPNRSLKKQRHSQAPIPR